MKLALAKACWLAFLFLIVTTAAHGRDEAVFGARTLAGDVVESRLVEAASSQAVLRAAIAVLQDIRYLVVEFDAESGLLVADPPLKTLRTHVQRPASSADEVLHSLSIRVESQAEQSGSFRVRISVVAPPAWAKAGNAAELEDGIRHFVYGFHQHLLGELHRQENGP